MSRITSDELKAYRLRAEARHCAHRDNFGCPDRGRGPKVAGVRASDGRPDDPFNGQCPVDDVARKYGRGQP